MQNYNYKVAQRPGKVLSCVLAPESTSYEVTVAMSELDSFHYAVLIRHEPYTVGELVAVTEVKKITKDGGNMVEVTYK